VSLSSTDVPQANDPERVLRLARYLFQRGVDQLPDDFAHARDKHFYLAALRVLRALDDAGVPTERLAKLARDGNARQVFAAVFAESPVGAAWMSWATATSLEDLDPASATEFLIAASGSRRALQSAAPARSGDG